MLMQEPENALEVYNGLNNTNYTDATLIEMKILDKGISLSVRNDAAFIVGMDINMYEHQSSYNPNMALRHFVYFSRILDSLLSNKDLFSWKKISIPQPHFVVFYNGTEKRPAVEIQKLSEHFEKMAEKPEVELTCTIYNINPGYNERLLEKCPVLRDYMSFVERIRENIKAGKDIEEAIDSAIDSCLNDDILTGFLTRRRNEVTKETMIDMRFEAREKLIRRDAYDDGKIDGKTEGIVSMVCKKLRKGKTLEQIAEDLEEDIKEIEKICEVAEKYAPEYDTDKIVSELIPEQVNS